MGPVSDWAQIRAAAVLYEDDAALVLNKAGLSVMGERHDTDLVRLAEEAGEKLYPAHRIDKVTSGVLLLAKDLAWHGDLTRQFNRRTVDKVYLAITATTGLPGPGHHRAAAQRRAQEPGPGGGQPGRDRLGPGPLPLVDPAG